MPSPLVLIADDASEVRRIVARCLQAIGLVSIEAQDGLAGIEAARVRLQDLVITDLSMPRASGRALCRMLRGDPRTRHIPIIVLTGHGSTRSTLELLDLGADDYISKPFQCDELTARVRAVLRRTGDCHDAIGR